ncbi:ATP-dependent bile acid permease [Cordyceps fumosorosea ARSEF 2679]|uniref:ATP-dependent bile acid permease n=1 Tax=Cordyceps fumosorosea (strain ARSEF 2679) TaxID=1081104 RepID=A0A162I8X3_CORFA|nr:ATP-dependent bile acid permease [Cordyceps fumosorosea ARSEF 2679]OAA53855.1 ATP-dependent bile acid permease [Cordyceps fumosorosea ARSEF 2679]
MGGFAQCSWPIWRVDDFTLCFQVDLSRSALRLCCTGACRKPPPAQLPPISALPPLIIASYFFSYLRVILPLLLVALSATRIIFFNVARIIENRRTQGYDAVQDADPHVVDHTALPPDPDSDSEQDLEIHGGRLSKTISRGSVVHADQPHGQLLSNVVETLAVVAIVALNITALITGTGSYGQRARLAATASLIVWLYTFALVSLRLFLGNSKWRVPHLWNHTATIYTVTWVCSLVVFRSALINPSSNLAQAIAIAEFASITLLWGMAITTRKGNKTVLMEWENGLEPSREPLASLFSIVTFSWVDDIVWAGWKTPLEMNAVWNLLPRDKAANVIAGYRSLKQTGSLVVHLLKYFQGPLTGQCLLAALAGVFTFAPTMLLKYILEYVENPDAAPRNVIWLFVILLPVLDTIRSISDNISLWTGRKICIRMRAIIIGDVYAKALRRKAAAGAEKTLGDSPDDDTAKGPVSTIRRALGFKSKKKAQDKAQDKTAATTDEQTNLGTIINLMSVDSYKISETTAYLHFLVGAAPVQLAVSVFLLWQVMGLSAIPGIIVMIFLVPVNYLLANGFSVTSKKIMAATDKRIHVTNEVLQNIRIIKYFAWEKRFGTIIDEKRENELKAMRSRYVLWSVAVAIWNSVPVLITFFSFVVFTLVEKRPLYPSIAFTAISLFMLLRIPLDMLGDMFAHVQEAKVSVERVEEFLQEGETEKYEQLGTDNVDEEGVKRIGFRDTTLSWSSKDSKTEDGPSAFRLWDLNIDFQIGKLNIIAGPTGSGKTSLLMGLLGEMSLYNGKVFCPGGRSRDDVRPDPETGLADTIAYVAQAAWLLNGSIKTNILFGAPYNEKRYNDVIVACALERDLDILDHGDETLVGEKGITLSGGQKQRISLARAVYSDSAHILMDDCLSAVDSHTAHWIFHRCLKGPLMEDRTCILVTHNVQLCAPQSDFVVVLDNGRVKAQGASAELIATGELGEDLQKSRPGSVLTSRAPSRASSFGETTVVEGTPDSPYKPKAKKKVAPQVDPMDEGKATGAIKWPVVKLYLFSMGSYWFWIIALVVFQLQQLAPVATNVWVRAWANQYVEEDVRSVAFSSASASYNNQFHPKAAWATIAKLSNLQVDQSPAYADAYTVAGQVPISIAKPAHEVDAVYYVFGLAFIGALGAFTAFVRDIWIFFGSLTASRRLHSALLSSVMRARFKFFDVTPLGQIVNRFSKDLEAVDQDIAPTAIGVLACALSLIVTIVLIAVITPAFLFAAVFIGILFYGVSVLYLRASRDLKRLESVQRSPLFQQFGETLSGMTTIRAYGVERRFILENLDKVNTSNRPFIYLWALNRWLAFRADFIGNSVSFFAGVFIILSIGKIDAGAAGISLSYAMSFTDNVLWLVRQYGTNEQNMNSMERIKEYLDVEQEADAIVEDNRPAETWPEKGGVEFINYSTRYRADLEPVLRSISLKINAKEKVGIVGRTGAGKSSLTLALFRALEADRGEILVDGVNIGAIGLQDLREKITIVPQDPTLFTGTLRSNLDPFDQYTDGQIFEALRRVHLIGEEDTSAPATPISAVASNKNIFRDLSSPVAESGSNLSQGQRQLLCLARAMLKKPKVLVMDEATASIDYTTDSKIQETIREMRGTVITIAHRLQTIVDYDKVLVLDKGEMIEYAHPWELISNQDSQFHSMCESSGDLEILKKAAKKKWDADRLVSTEAQ